MKMFILKTILVLIFCNKYLFSVHNLIIINNSNNISDVLMLFQFNLQVPEKNLNYRTQLLHSHLREVRSESSTHLKINYNNLMPLVAGLHWKSPPKHSLQKKWEGENQLLLAALIVRL